MKAANHLSKKHMSVQIVSSKSEGRLEPLFLVDVVNLHGQPLCFKSEKLFTPRQRFIPSSWNSPNKCPYQTLLRVSCPPVRSCISRTVAHSDPCILHKPNRFLLRPSPHLSFCHRILRARHFSVFWYSMCNLDVCRWRRSRFCRRMANNNLRRLAQGFNGTQRAKL